MSHPIYCSVLFPLVPVISNYPWYCNEPVRPWILHYVRSYTFAKVTSYKTSDLFLLLHAIFNCPRDANQPNTRFPMSLNAWCILLNSLISLCLSSFVGSCCINLHSWCCSLSLGTLPVPLMKLNTHLFVCCLFVYTASVMFDYNIYCRGGELSCIRGLGASLHLLKRVLGSLTCLRMALSQHRASIYSMIWTACQTD